MGIRKLCVTSTFFCLIMVFATIVYSDEIFIPPINTDSSQVIVIPIRVDQVENLAGMKIVITYDPKVIIYEEADKTEHTSSLLHLVNDKKPGKLVIVMAGAKGISGKNIDLIHLKFSTYSNLKEAVSTKLIIEKLELMDDKLVQLKYKKRSGILVLR